MGMTAHEYWEEDCSLVVGYRKAYQIKNDEVNATAWLNGLYTYIALSTALNNGFSNHKSEYPKKPLGTDEKKAKTESPEEIRDRYYNRFKRMQEMWDKAQDERNNTENPNDF